MEHYSRKEIIEIYGVPQFKNENTNQIALEIFQDMHILVKLNGIRRPHRARIIPKTKHGKPLPSPILVKLISHDLKDYLYQRHHRLRQLEGYKGIQ